MKGLAWVALGAAWLLAPVARAEPVRARLEWSHEGAEACPRPDGVVRSAAELLGRDVFVSDPKTAVRVSGRSTRTDSGFAVRLEIRRGGALAGVRELETSPVSCDELEQSIALVLVLLLEAEEAEARLKLPPPIPQAAPVKPAPEWRLATGLSFGATAGILPGVSPVVRLESVAQRGALPPLAFDAAVLLPTSAETAGGGVTMEAWTLGLALCPYDALSGKLWLRACAGPAFGRIHAAGFGFSQAFGASRSLWNLDARLEASIAIAGPLAVLPAIGAGVLFVRDRFVVTEVDGTKAELFRPAPAYLRVDLGLGFRVP